jgi:hypothetical protein
LAAAVAVLVSVTALASVMESALAEVSASAVLEPARADSEQASEEAAALARSPRMQRQKWQREMQPAEDAHANASA